MKTAILLGNKNTKRSIYFEQAAQNAGLPVQLTEWAQWIDYGFHCPDKAYIKIDPPVWETCALDRLEDLTDTYRKHLEDLERTPSAVFLNTPSSIAALLDKRECKRTLSGAGLPVTEPVLLPGSHAKGLMEAMRDQRTFQVFVKPVKGSGAAGAAAFRCHPSTGRVALYTCAFWDNASSSLVNTKRLRSFTAPDDVFFLLDKLLSMNCVVERWYPKAEYNGYSYDLRAVIQEGNMDFLLARLSKGPITNLHLNNHPLEASLLGLPESVLDEIEILCRRAVFCYPGLNSAGIDILLEKGSLKPRIIEMNGQGDLLYQDIYSDNAIYFHQASMMKKWMDADQCLPNGG